MTEFAIQNSWLVRRYVHPWYKNLSMAVNFYNSNSVRKLSAWLTLKAARKIVRPPNRLPMWIPRGGFRWGATQGHYREGPCGTIQSGCRSALNACLLTDSDHWWKETWNWLLSSNDFLAQCSINQLAVSLTYVRTYLFTLRSSVNLRFLYDTCPSFYIHLSCLLFLTLRSRKSLSTSSSTDWISDCLAG